MINYVQIDENNIVIGLSQLNGEVNNPNLIKIEKYDGSLLGKLYENGKFIDMDYYAEVDSNNIVVDILRKPCNETNFKANDNYIPIKHEDHCLIGSKYENGKFIIVNNEMEEIKDMISTLMKKLEKLENK